MNGEFSVIPLHEIYIYRSTHPLIDLKRDEKMKDDILWLMFEGLDKVEILKGMGFEINSSGYLFLDGKDVRSIDGSENVRADQVKAIVPGSLAVVTDISEMEPLFE